MEDIKERRRSKRRNFADLSLIFTLKLNEAANPENPIRLEARNINLHGLKFQTNYRISLFQQLAIILFDKKAQSDPIPLKAKVVRVEEMDTGRSEIIYGIAVQFEPIGKVEEDRLKLFFISE